MGSIGHAVKRAIRAAPAGRARAPAWSPRGNESARPAFATAYRATSASTSLRPWSPPHPLPRAQARSTGPGVRRPPNRSALRAPPATAHRAPLRSSGRTPTRPTSCAPAQQHGAEPPRSARKPRDARARRPDPSPGLARKTAAPGLQVAPREKFQNERNTPALHTPPQGPHAIRTPRQHTSRRATRAGDSPNAGDSSCTIRTP